jgi:adenosine deaminase CECR1
MFSNKIKSLLFFYILIIELSLQIDPSEYMRLRDELEFKSKGSYNNRFLTLKETQLDLFLKNEKLDELSKNSLIHFNLPIEDYINRINKDTLLYKLIEKMPKGGNLHMHEPEMLNRRTFLEIIFNSTEFNYLYICNKEKYPKSSCLINSFKFFPIKEIVPYGWESVANVANDKGKKHTLDYLVKKTTLIGVLNDLKMKKNNDLNSNENERWKLVVDYGLMDNYNEVMRHNQTRFKYLKAYLDLCLRENVQLVELRRELNSRLFFYDENLNEIEISLDDEYSLLREFKKQYLRENQKMIDFSFIIYDLRTKSREKVKHKLHEAIQMHKKYPDLIKGFDLVCEEERGNSLLYYFMNGLMQNANLEEDLKTFRFVFHAGETNWNDNLNAMNNNYVSTLSNLFDAILLNSKRIGHALGLFKMPYLYNYLIEHDIAIEVCPLSNNILGKLFKLKS